jgi:DNA-binding MarR family transcriptional regulator
MSSDSSSRQGLMAQFLSGFRRLREQAVLLNDAVAEHLNMAASDVECLGLLATSGPMTAGRLAELSGLSTGAVTRMIDRLEQAGYVKRTADPTDRRRVVVEAVTERVGAVSRLFEALGVAIGTAMEHYSDDELRFLVDFLDRSTNVTRAEADRLRTSVPEDESGPHQFAVPLGGTTAGRLVFLSGFADVSIGADTNRDRLFSARFSGPTPKIRVRGGIVTVHALPIPHQWLNPQGEVSFSASIPFAFDLRRGLGKVKADVSPKVEFKTRGRRDGQPMRGELLLGPAVPWDIDVKGGLSHFSADLRGLDVRSLDITGGSSGASLLLPSQTGRWVRVKLIGGASDVRIQRPSDTSVRVRVRGGVSQLDLDDQHYSSLGGGDVRLNGSSSADAGYEIEIVGGASRFSIGTVDAVGPAGGPAAG